MNDTPDQQALRHAALLAARTPEQRIDALRAVDRGMRRLVFARLRQRHPNATDRELVIRHVAQVHGVDVARRLYPDAPEDL